MRLAAQLIQVSLCQPRNAFHIGSGDLLDSVIKWNTRKRIERERRTQESIALKARKILTKKYMVLEKYEVPTMEIVEFETEDVIVASGGTNPVDLFALFGFEEYDVFVE